MAIILAAARVLIRIYYLKRVNVDDYFFIVAIATLIPGAGLFFSYIKTAYAIEAVLDRKASLPPYFLQTLENAATYAQIAQLLCWITIFSIKFSFLFYFRALVNRLYKMEIWWWCTLVVLVPTAAVSIAGSFIACPHTGSSYLVDCNSSPAFLRREHGILDCLVVLDIVTDFMLISIPVIVLRTASLGLRRKLSIAVVLCLSLFMIAIALVRGVSARVTGTENQQIWICFWVQVEAPISVIAACPIAFRNLFLLNHNSKNIPDKGHGNEGQNPKGGRFWEKRINPSLPTIGTGATLTGLRTMIRKNGQTQLESGDHGGYALSSTITPSHQSSPSFEAPERDAKLKHEAFQTMV